MVLRSSSTCQDPMFAAALLETASDGESGALMAEGDAQGCVAEARGRRTLFVGVCAVVRWSLGVLGRYFPPFSLCTQQRV
jgi:hypothetical protein